VFPTPVVSSPSARLVDNIQACSSPTHDSALSKTKKPSETLRELGSAEPMFAVCKRWRRSWRIDAALFVYRLAVVFLLGWVGAWHTSSIIAPLRPPRVQDFVELRTRRHVHYRGTLECQSFVHVVLEADEGVLA